MKNFAKNSSPENSNKYFLDQRSGNRISSAPPPHLGTNPISNPLSMFELESAICMAKINSSPGEDGVRYEMIKQLPRSSKKIVLTFLNRIWRDGIIPHGRKHSIVLPIPKPGKDSKNLNSYHLIPLTDSPCKVNECIITTRL